MSILPQILICLSLDLLSHFLSHTAKANHRIGNGRQGHIHDLRCHFLDIAQAMSNETFIRPRLLSILLLDIYEIGLEIVLLVAAKIRMGLNGVENHLDILLLQRNLRTHHIVIAGDDSAAGDIAPDGYAAFFSLDDLISPDEIASASIDIAANKSAAVRIDLALRGCRLPFGFLQSRLRRQVLPRFPTATGCFSSYARLQAVEGCFIFQVLTKFYPGQARQEIGDFILFWLSGSWQ